MILKDGVRLLLLIVIVLVAVGPTQADPALTIGEDTFDFGKVCQHAKVSHTFWIKSTGTDTLVINKVIPGCGCTRAPLQDSVLAPGDSTSLEIIFSTKSYRGYVSKRPYVETNIGDEKYYVKIKSELLPRPEEARPLTLTPFRLDVSQFTKKTRRKASFSVENHTDVSYKITLIDHGQSFDVELPPEIGASATIEGVVTVHEDAVETDFEQSLTFELDDDGKTRYSVPVKRKFRPQKKN